jgi:hypothetical protein
MTLATELLRSAQTTPSACSAHCGITVLPVDVAPVRPPVGQRTSTPELRVRSRRGPSEVCLPLGEPARLTRRGVVVLSIAVAVAGAGLMLVARWSHPAPETAPPASGSVLTVHPGDTLWSIARAVAPERDPRAVVAKLRERNRLTTVDLTPGQTLKVW